MNESAEQEFSPAIAINKKGWFALRHREGWWVGTKEGVTCYEDHYFARIALTILWQRSGGKACEYKIEPFTGADTHAGELTLPKSGDQAIKDYERKWKP